MPSPRLATCGNRLACQRHCSASRAARHRRRFYHRRSSARPIFFRFTPHRRRRPLGMVAAPPKAHQRRSIFAQQLRQLGDVGGDAPRLIAGETVHRGHRRAPVRWRRECRSSRWPGERPMATGSGGVRHGDRLRGSRAGGRVVTAPATSHRRFLIFQEISAEAIKAGAVP